MCPVLVLRLLRSEPLLAADDMRRSVAESSRAVCDGARSYDGPGMTAMDVYLKGTTVFPSLGLTVGD